MNMRQFTNKLPVKISFCLFLFVCIPMLICNLGLQLYLKSNIVRNTTFAFENAAVNIENTFENVFSEIGITLNLLSTDPALYNTLESSPESFNEELKRKISVDSLTAQYQQHILYCTVDFLILDASDRLYSTYYIQDQDTLLQNLNLHCRPQIQYKYRKMILTFHSFPFPWIIWAVTQILPFSVSGNQYGTINGSISALHLRS